MLQVTEGRTGEGIKAARAPDLVLRRESSCRRMNLQKRYKGGGGRGVAASAGVPRGFFLERQGGHKAKQGQKTQLRVHQAGNQRKSSNDWACAQTPLFSTTTTKSMGGGNSEIRIRRSVLALPPTPLPKLGRDGFVPVNRGSALKRTDPEIPRARAQRSPPVTVFDQSTSHILTLHIYFALRFLEKCCVHHWSNIIKTAHDLFSAYTGSVSPLRRLLSRMFLVCILFNT